MNDTHVPEWQEWAKAHGLEPPMMRGATTLHASNQVLGAALEGLGMAIGRRPLVDRWLDEGKLVAPFGASGWSGAACFLVYPEEFELPVAARKVARWLHAMAAEEKARLGALQPTSGRQASASQVRSSAESVGQPERVPKTRR